jgi:hypothetical protein
LQRENQNEHESICRIPCKESWLEKIPFKLLEKIELANTKPLAIWHLNYKKEFQNKIPNPTKRLLLIYVTPKLQHE